MFVLNILAVIAFIFSMPAGAWGSNAWQETEAQKTERMQTAQKQQELAQKKQEQDRAIAQVKGNFRLESSYNALKEARKSFACFVVVYPFLAYALNYFNAAAGSSCYEYIPYSVLALCILWGTENILRGQVELNKQQHADLTALVQK